MATQVHILTALSMINQDAAFSHKLLLNAREFPNWTEDLTHNDYPNLRQIAKTGTPGDLIEWVYSVLPKYFNIWSNLGMPATREEWNAKYGPMYEKSLAPENFPEFVE